MPLKVHWTPFTIAINNNPGTARLPEPANHNDLYPCSIKKYPFTPTLNLPPQWGGLKGRVYGVLWINREKDFPASS